MEFYVNCTKDVYSLDIIKWAFERGYQLANADNKNGVHIQFSETEKYFLNELDELNESKIKKNTEVYDDISII
jgi:putative NIF3 family GTP cyclohydrolase 1 type 2